MSATAPANDPTFENVWDEIVWRGLVHVSTDQEALRALLAGAPITYYCGFDPTAPSLHLGNLVQLLLMRRLQLAGHKPLGLVGGSTGLIGDPRPSAERTLNTKETVAEWVGYLRSQVERFLSFDGDNAARIVNNLDWTAPLSAIDFLREIGKHYRVGTMLKKDAVSARLNSDAGISYTEFSYQILQGLDYLELFRSVRLRAADRRHRDQWGNLTSGVDLIHRVEGVSVHAIGTPLITNTDGTKFGKSEGNAIWLDAAMCSPYRMYQFWLNTDDADVIPRLKIFTFLTRAEIEELRAARAGGAVPPGGAEAPRSRGDDVRARTGCGGRRHRGIRGPLRSGRPGDARRRDAAPGARRAAERDGRRRDERRPGARRHGTRLESGRGPPGDRPGRRVARRRQGRGRHRDRDRLAARGSVGAAPRQEDARGRVRRLTNRPRRSSSEPKAAMPFTPSHAIVALPFVRTPLVPAAIAIGAMAPDLPLFVRGLPLHYGRTHDLVWLPMTMLLALALLARLAVRAPSGGARAVAAMAGRAAARRLGSRSAGRAARHVRRHGGPHSRTAAAVVGVVAGCSLLLVLSLALGVVSHIVWDLFTHEGRGGVDLIPALAEQWGPLAGYKWLQHGSSVLGLAILASWMVVWLVRRQAAASVPCLLPGWVRWAWWLSLPVVLAGAWLVGLVAYGPLGLRVHRRPPGVPGPSARVRAVGRRDVRSGDRHPDRAPEPGRHDALTSPDAGIAGRSMDAVVGSASWPSGFHPSVVHA